MKLIDFARTHGAELLPPVPEEQILQFEAQRRLKIPSELRSFYLAAGGTRKFTELGWKIWPFEELTTIESRAGTNPDIECLSGYETSPTLSDYLAFIDVLIEAPLYAVCANPASCKFGEVISLAGDNKPFLAGPIKALSDFESILATHWNDVVLPDTINSESGLHD